MGGAVNHNAAPPMPDLAKLVVKSFPENRNMQLMCLRVPAQFRCSRCNMRQKANLMAVVAGDWGQLLCLACYEKMLSEIREEPP
jgi:hypothetical protein